MIIERPGLIRIVQEGDVTDMGFRDAVLIDYLWNRAAGGQTYNATQFGWYTVEVLDPEGCTGGDSIYLMPPTGIVDQFLQGQLKVYPVPSSRFLHIEYQNEEAENLFLEIFDSSGRKIIVKQFSNVMEIFETVDVTGLARGLYDLRLRSDERQLTRKITLN